MIFWLFSRLNGSFDLFLLYHGEANGNEIHPQLLFLSWIIYANPRFCYSFSFKRARFMYFGCPLYVRVVCIGGSFPWSKKSEDLWLKIADVEWRHYNGSSRDSSDCVRQSATFQMNFPQQREGEKIYQEIHFPLRLYGEKLKVYSNKSSSTSGARLYGTVDNRCSCFNHFVAYGAEQWT